MPTISGEQALYLKFVVSTEAVAMVAIEVTELN
jgi:hypothetical protein